MIQKILLAVCDNLKKNYNNHNLLKTEHTKYIGEYISKPIYELYKLKDDFFKYALLENGNTSLLFEVYMVPIEVIENLEDYYEFNEKVYCLKDIMTPYGKGKVLIREKKIINCEYLETV